MPKLEDIERWTHLLRNVSKGLQYVLEYSKISPLSNLNTKQISASPT